MTDVREAALSTVPREEEAGLGQEASDETLEALGASAAAAMTTLRGVNC